MRAFLIKSNQQNDICRNNFDKYLAKREYKLEERNSGTEERAR